MRRFQQVTGKRCPGNPFIGAVIAIVYIVLNLEDIIYSGLIKLLLGHL